MALNPNMNDVQRLRLARQCAGKGVPFDENTFHPQFDLPPGYVAGWIGDVYIGIDEEGAISS